MKFKRRNLEAFDHLIVGNVGRDDAANGDEAKHFPYRSIMYITEFFQELDTEYEHDGSTCHRWVADVLEQMLAVPHDSPNRSPEIFCRRSSPTHSAPGEAVRWRVTWSDVLLGVSDRYTGHGDTEPHGEELPALLHQVQLAEEREPVASLASRVRDYCVRDAVPRSIYRLVGSRHKPEPSLA